MPNYRDARNPNSNTQTVMSAQVTLREWELLQLIRQVPFGKVWVLCQGGGMVTVGVEQSFKYDGEVLSAVVVK